MTDESSSPVIVGITGASCSGKTLLARGLLAALPGAVLLATDSYYRDLGHLSAEERALTNFDAPEAIEHELFIAHLQNLNAGRAVKVPVYDFTTHTRRPEVVEVAPGPHVIVEGLFALYWAAARSLMRWKVFVSAPDSVCLARRQQRDVAERGRTAESVAAQYAATVLPMYEAHCRPAMAFADAVLDGCDVPENLVKRVIADLGRL